MNGKSILYLPFPLSDSQRAIVSSDSKYIKVVAAAGTGKTETISRKILYSILEEGVDPKEIVAFTFTERAAKEMKARVYAIANSIGDQYLIDRLNSMYIGTIHAYCKRILEDHFSYGDYVLFDDNKEIAYLLKVGWKLGINKYENSYTRSVLQFHKTKNMVYSELIGEDDLKSNSKDFYEKFKEYGQYLKQDKVMTFSTIIHNAIVELRKDPINVQKLDLSYLFVDEFQDINPSQYALIKLLVSSGARLMVVGDERQTIYQWRGSNHKLFTKIDNEFNGVKTMYLNDNRRSTKNIVDNANFFSKTIEGRFEDMIPSRPENYPLIMRSFLNEEDEADWIADTVQDLVSMGRLRYGDIAILLRSVKSKGKAIIDKFRKKEIPYQIGGNIGLFQRDEGQILGMFIAWLVDKEWNFNGSIVKENDLLRRIKDLAVGIFHLNLNKINDKDFYAIKEKVLKGVGKNSYQNITELFQDFLVKMQFKNLDPNDPLDAISMANVGRLNNLLTDFETARRIGGRSASWKNDLIALYYFITTYAQDAYEEAQPDFDNEMNAVLITTVHQAKGLEWPLVFLPEMNKNTFPSSLVGKPQKWCEISTNLFDVKRYEGTDDDERRLFYVAITRPRDLMAISSIEGKESPYLIDMNKSCFGIPDLKSPDFNAERKRESPTLEFSPSEIIWYLRCPYMYRMRKDWGFQPGLKEEIGFGNAMHSVLRNAVALMKEEVIPVETVIKESSDRYFHLPFAGDRKHNTLKKKSEDILDKFVREFPEFLSNAEDVEYRITYRNGKVTLSGRADVVLSKDSGHAVVDYKTSKNVNTKEEAEIQIGAYAIGLMRMGRKPDLGKIAYLEECEVENIDLNEQKIVEIENKIENIIAGIELKKFDPNVSEKCVDCDMRRLCRYGGYDE